MFLKLGDNVPKGSFGWPILGETLGFLKPHPSNTIGAFLQDHCSSITKSKPEFFNDIERIAVQILNSWKDKQQVMFCEEARKARSRISSRVKAIIEERRSRNGRSCGVRNDFLEILLSVDTLSEDEKVSFVLDSLLGGYETTSLLMAMVVHLLGQSPTASEQLKVINEALRYGNIVKFVHRKALKDVKFRDHLIPSGWKVLPVFTAVHLDSSVHADALQFHPWRWEAQDQTCKKFTPFGGGSRCCPGSELAKIEIAFFLHHLLQNFRWTAEDVDQPMAYPYVEFGKGLLINLDRCSI
ncbi:hypothetical protein OIU77_011123 [Salix suchowensis]|uniref:Uncharacterized protein n=1 Tax=Salix suchowensis TaxID=1278906 RepID=A0ABQ9ABH9_9ROSI|nr:hypothetical protein OIU77_011123 [Salix suchowensis]